MMFLSISGSYFCIMNHMDSEINQPQKVKIVTMLKFRHFFSLYRPLKHEETLYN